MAAIAVPPAMMATRGMSYRQAQQYICGTVRTLSQCESVSVHVYACVCMCVVKLHSQLQPTQEVTNCNTITQNLSHGLRSKDTEDGEFSTHSK